MKKKNVSGEKFIVAKSLIPSESIINRILFIRNQKVILDKDLAILYGVETRALKQAVKEILNDSHLISCLYLTIKKLMAWYHKM